MNFLFRQKRWKYLLFFLATSIVVFTVWYTRNLANAIATEETQKAEDIADAYSILNSNSTDELELSKALEKIKDNTNIPVIWADKEHIVFAYKNFDSAKVNQDTTYLLKQIMHLRSQHHVIEIDLANNQKQYLYYKDSDLLVNIRKYPFYVLAMVALFFIISFAAFSASRRAEQNQVWVGLAKETAHQLGTPLSSLSAWTEILQQKITAEKDQYIFDEMQKDLDRLVLIAERFSKIGSVPELSKNRVADILQNGIDYIAKRASKKIEITMNPNVDMNLFAALNPPLFEWVLENIMKNALDAMDEKGAITLNAIEQDNQIIIDISDTGKGITKGQLEQIFEPGFSTKKRGWGLGLTLARRIVEEYHHGKIYVKESSSKGTTFRILINKIID